MIDLDSLLKKKSGWVVTFAFGINGSGTHNNQNRAYLLTLPQKYSP